MDHQRFLQLHHDYCVDTVALSFTQRNHPAYQELLQTGQDIVPWLLQRLRDSVGHDEGDTFDHTNSPWLSIELLSLITDCLHDMPRKYAGRLDKVRGFILKWGKDLPPTTNQT